MLEENARLSFLAQVTKFVLLFNELGNPEHYLRVAKSFERHFRHLAQSEILEGWFSLKALAQTLEGDKQDKLSAMTCGSKIPSLLLSQEAQISSGNI